MRKRMRSFVVFSTCAAWLLLCACISPVNQLRTIPFRTLTGMVVDNSGQPVKQAIVTTDPPTSTLLTDDLGKFLLTSLPEGVYTIQTVKQGFAINSAVIAIKGLGPFHIDVQLNKRVSAGPGEKERLLPQTRGRENSEKKEKEEGSSWWPTQ
ncbi:MAG: carboxypeptidase-like regulatory domain-containing protein [bacterium]